MGKNLNQVYSDNPAISIQDTDIFYLIRSPYGITDDFGVPASIIKTYATASVPSFPLSLANGGTGQNLTAINNGVFSTNGSGITQLSTTLPSGLTIPGYATTSALSAYLPLAGGTLTGVLQQNSGQIHAVTEVGAATYNALSTDFILACNYFAGSVAITLPVSPVIGRAYRIKDITGMAATNNITIIGTIDGLSDYVINTNWGSVDLVWTGARWGVL